VSDFLDWLGDHAWSVWLGLALIFGIVETVSLDLVFLMLAGGALGGLVSSLFGVSFTVQAVVAIATSAALLLVVRPVAKRHLQVPLAIRTGAAALVGSQAIVVQKIGPDTGLVKLGGETWTARAYDGRQVIAVGRTVDVLEIKGATALVFDSEVA
jgi:membrane protein implicated in regulation of membrane protease activity